MLLSRRAPPAPSQYAGWIWKSDTSSDEIVGHLFGLSVASYLSPLPDERQLAATLLVELVRGIVVNGFTLVDPSTGKPTTWGHWDPPAVNGQRSLSDGNAEFVLSVQVPNLQRHSATSDGPVAQCTN